MDNFVRCAHSVPHLDVRYNKMIPRKFVILIACVIPVSSLALGGLGFSYDTEGGSASGGITFSYHSNTTESGSASVGVIYSPMSFFYLFCCYSLTLKKREERI